MTTATTLDQRIASAAQALIHEQGEFTMAELETRIAVSRATLYRRVGSKAALLQKLAHARGERFEHADTRLDVLRAARRVFAREGIAAATMEQIASQAGVGVATLYRHFGDKEGLIQAFIEAMVPRSAVLQLARNPGEDLANELQDMVEALLAFFHEHRDILRLVMLGSQSERRYLSAFRSGSETTLSMLTDYFRGQQEAGRIDATAGPQELSLALMGMVLAFAIVGPLHYGTTLADAALSAARITSIILGGHRREQP